MRSSQALLPALACLSLALGAIPHGSAQRAVPFCGSPPPGWTPPGRKPVAPEQPQGACHLMLCSTKKARPGFVPEANGDDLP